MSEYPEEVLHQQEAIRRSGMINMFDMRGVKQIAEDMGYDELAEFIEKSSANVYIEMAKQARSRADHK
ncbi:MAG: hypothetical protein J07AB43_02050 [Candidatus Nanosalina sp. J07AB43]|nr:MAG: hypothetical protein J07AB43_02050 [Candidatus Nanosalina sp. J07AB43]